MGRLALVDDAEDESVARFGFLPDKIFARLALAVVSQ